MKNSKWLSLCKFGYFLFIYIAQSAGAVEYTDYIYICVKKN